MNKRLSAALVALCAWLLPFMAFAASSAQMANGRQQFLNGSGAPLASGVVYIYLPNTTTPVTTYQDPGLTQANTNPIILDSNGMASIWVTPGNYREVVQDSLGNTLFDATTSAAGTSAASLSPGATIGANGDVSCTATLFTGGGNITLPCAINANAVTNADLAQMAANTLKGNNTASTANAADLSVAQASAMLAATGAQVKAGASNGVLISPAAFVAAGQSVSASCGTSCTGGYITLPGGVIEQWLHYTPAGGLSGSTFSVTFPTTFPTSCDFVSVTVDASSALSGVQYGPVLPSTPTTTGASIALVGYTTASRNNATGVWVFAVGH